MIEQTAWVHAMAGRAVGQAVIETSNLNSQNTSWCSLKDPILFVDKPFLLKVLFTLDRILHTETLRTLFKPDV